MMQVFDGYFIKLALNLTLFYFAYLELSELKIKKLKFLNWTLEDFFYQ
jgi:hypothetical protein